MRFALILATFIAAAVAAPAAEAQPEAQLDNLEKRCLPVGADCISTPNDCCGGSCFMDKGSATYRCF